MYSYHKKKKVGFIVNKFNGLFEEFCTKGDKFIIDFPE